VSEYQYYEFQAVDLPLDAKALAAVRALSTRARITPTSFVNTYQPPCSTRKPPSSTAPPTPPAPGPAVSM